MKLTEAQTGGIYWALGSDVSNLNYACNVEVHTQPQRDPKMVVIQVEERTDKEVKVRHTKNHRKSFSMK
ncbi:MAG TPA: hypothetical protein VEA59_07290 [Patescibacteria group bacterium]|nr:hypothetical protein [Patescibacteria group bacterium]